MRCARWHEICFLPRMAPSVCSTVAVAYLQADPFADLSTELERALGKIVKVR